MYSMYTEICFLSDIYILCSIMLPIGHILCTVCSIMLPFGHILCSIMLPIGHILCSIILHRWHILYCTVYSVHPSYPCSTCSAWQFIFNVSAPDTTYLERPGYNISGAPRIQHIWSAPDTTYLERPGYNISGAHRTQHIWSARTQHIWSVLKV